MCVQSVVFPSLNDIEAASQKKERKKEEEKNWYWSNSWFTSIEKEVLSDNVKCCCISDGIIYYKLNMS